MSENGSIIFGGRYELKKRLARGGMAEVFLAEDQLLGRPVAVKVLFPEFASDPNFVERFRREAQAAANLNHPNIVGVFDWGKERNTYYIVMEYVEGKTLSQLIRKEGPLPAARVAEIADGIASALGIAHKGDVVHRDMKSGNVIISDTGQIKVADFGIATAISAGSDTDLTQTGAVMGTANYFSPEQAQGLTVDGRSDLYSLGVVMYEMLTGAPPFTGETSISIAYKHVQEQPEPISSKRQGVPEALQAITAKLLNKNPDRRYSSAGELQTDLQRFLSGRYTLDDSNLDELIEPLTNDFDTAEVSQVESSFDQQQDNDGPPYPPQYYEPYDRQDRRIWLWGVLTIGLLGALIALIVLLVDFVQNTTNSESDGIAIEQIQPVSPTGIIVPLVVDLDRGQAIALLQSRGLQVGRITTEIRDDVPSDRVLSQTPSQGTELEEGETVNIIVSVGPDSIQVPVVVGLTQEEAFNKLQNQGFVNIEIRKIKTNEYDQGVVAEQDPEASSFIEPTSIIGLRIADGRISDRIPNLTGQTLSIALDELEEFGWITSVEEVNDDSIAEGRVVATVPNSGSEHDLDQPVVIQISIGPSSVELPSVIGESPALAASILAGNGFMVAPQEECPVDPTDPNVGKVVSQDPPAGEAVEPGITITICVGVAVEPTPDPDPDPGADPDPDPGADPDPDPGADPDPG
ncbi:MAG: hypothetical protein CMA21_04805, partial [Euryarchaeota archaeon]|nr:hypothetical protein [Euryarchaeota archaeon]